VEGAGGKERGWDLPDQCQTASYAPVWRPSQTFPRGASPTISRRSLILAAYQVNTLEQCSVSKIFLNSLIQRRLPVILYDFEEFTVFICRQLKRRLRARTFKKQLAGSDSR